MCADKLIGRFGGQRLIITRCSLATMHTRGLASSG